MSAIATSAAPLWQRYALRRRIAVGGMAEIFLARHEMAGFCKDVVIKRLRAELVADGRVCAMFRDEGTIGSLINHPHTVHVYEVGVDEDTPYIAMEFIDGEELSALCRRSLTAGSFLPLHHACELIRQAALSLGHFHAARDESGRELNIVHCDISPTNLLITRDGFLKVIDFGISRFRGQEYRDEAVVPGKLSYMSPEQARREKLDHRSDLFALGIVLYEITLGRRLFRGPAEEVKARLIAGDIRPPTFSVTDYPGALESIVMRTLEMRPADRYSSAFDLADDLAHFIAEVAVPTGPVEMARYLDRLTGERRPELVSERDNAHGDDDLDFDRGLSDELGATVKNSTAVAEWDEFEEGDQAVADALGIDVGLVRTQTREDGGEEPDEAPTIAQVASDPGQMPAPAPSPFGESITRPRPAFNPADSIRPLDPPSSLGKMIASFIVGGALVYLALQFLG